MKSLAVFLLLGGCDLYWNTNNGDDTCNGAVAKEPANPGYRDPSDGHCEVPQGGGGGCPCGTTCGGEELPPTVDWPTCSGSCEALDQTACFATPGCHAAYLDEPVGSGATDVEFWGCWETAPSGPVEGGGCAALDAQDCSRHDDCIEIYNGTTSQFESCAIEPGTDACSDVDITCPNNSHCEEQCNVCDSANVGPCMGGCSPTCVPDQACDSQTCPPNYVCEESCSSDNTVCTNECVPAGNDAGACTGAVTCTIAVPACPSGTTAGIANGCYTGFCIPNACGAGNPGDCTTSGAMCAMAPPACPSGTVPGITDGCWSGYCIPDAACPMPACEALTSESACTARPDCLAIYNGMNCTCDGGSTNTCTCETETYARCETLMGL